MPFSPSGPKPASPVVRYRRAQAARGIVRVESAIPAALHSDIRAIGRKNGRTQGNNLARYIAIGVAAERQGLAAAILARRGAK